MKRSFTSILTIFALILSVTAFGAEPKYKFNLKSLSGEKTVLKDYKGKITVVNFWASWCGPCEKEMKHLNKIQKKFVDENVAVLGVNVDNKKKLAKQHLRGLKKRPLYPILFDKKNKATTNFDVTAIPSTYIFGPKGKLLYVGQGYIPGQEAAYKKAIRRALKKPKKS